MIYQLPQISYLRLRFQLSSRQNAQLSTNKGSMLRGAFGHTFRRVVCVAGPKQACETCMLKQKCSYKQIFEPDIYYKAPPFLRGLQTAPRPYIFYSKDKNKYFTAGETLFFDFTLIGNSTEYLPYIILVVTQMVEKGLGTRRIPFRVDNVFCQTGQTEQDDEHPNWVEIYNHDQKEIKNVPPPLRALNSINNRPKKIEALTLTFNTPTRLKFRNEYTQHFTFRMLVFKMLRRVLELAHFYSPEEQVNWQFHDLLVAADDVEIVENNLQWQDWTRKSNRQQTTMLMGGFVGSLKLAGNLAPFIDLLQMSEVLHVGKGTVFGNGKMEVLFDETD